MSRVITFSRFFPSYHPRKGEPTYFVEKVIVGLNAPPQQQDVYLDELLAKEIIDFDDLDTKPKYHTIRAGNRWNVGDKFSPRIWSARPYHSKQIQIAPDIEVKKVWLFEMDLNGVYSVNGKYLDNELYTVLAMNDGLSEEDMFYWFMPNYDRPKEFKGQIICWNEKINYQ